VRLPTYEFEDAQLHEAIERLLSSKHPLLAAASRRLQASPGTILAAELIERLA
jgi:hypothetical protein